MINKSPSSHFLNQVWILLHFKGSSIQLAWMKLLIQLPAISWKKGKWTPILTVNTRQALSPEDHRTIAEGSPSDFGLGARSCYPWSHSRWGRRNSRLKISYKIRIWYYVIIIIMIMERCDFFSLFRVKSEWNGMMMKTGMEGSKEGRIMWRRRVGFLISRVRCSSVSYLITRPGHNSWSRIFR